MPVSTDGGCESAVVLNGVLWSQVVSIISQSGPPVAGRSGLRLSPSQQQTEHGRVGCGPIPSLCKRQWTGGPEVIFHYGHSTRHLGQIQPQKDVCRDELPIFLHNSPVHSV